MFKLFKKSEPAAPKDDPAVPAILLNKLPRPDLPGAPGCWIGGLPTLPLEIEWPWYIYQGEPLAPMHFIAQIRLDCLPKADGLPDFPATGTLFFFHACVLESYLGNDERGYRVINVDADVSHYPQRPMPAFPAFSALPPFEDWEAIFEESGTGTRPLNQWNIDFKLFDTFGEIHGPVGEKGHAIKEALMKESYDGTKSATKLHIDEGALHHMFGADITGFGPPGNGNLNLLTIQSEEDIGSGDLHHTQCTQFIIHKSDLRSRNWSAVTLGGGGS